MEIANTRSIDTHIEKVGESLAQGGLALLLDRGEQVGAGYLVAGAQVVSGELIATMLREAVGMPWLALIADRCEALGLTRMSDAPPQGRDMLVTFEAREGVTTGISAADRALSMRVAATTGSTGADIVTPGHVLPVRVAVDSPPTRWTVAEAAVELAAVAGLPGGAALCQVMDEEGRPAEEPELRALAARLEIPTADTLDLIDRHLRQTELIERGDAERRLESPIGYLRCITYRDRATRASHFAIVVGDVSSPEPTAVEAIAQDIPKDVFGTEEIDSRSRISDALTKLAGGGGGILLYLAQDAATIDRYLATILRSHLVTQILGDLGVEMVERL